MGWGGVVVQAAAWGAELGAGETSSPSQEPLAPVISPCSIWELGHYCIPSPWRKACEEDARVPAAEQLRSPGTAQPWPRAVFFHLPLVTQLFIFPFEGNERHDEFS